MDIYKESVDEYVKRAEEAQKNRAHVAVLFNYRNAIEWTHFCEDAVEILSAAVQYATNLKKPEDRQTVADWSQTVVNRIKAAPGLIDTVNAEITKLQTRGNENATA